MNGSVDTPRRDIAARLELASQPRRLRILELVWDRELSAGEIAARIPVTFAAVSQHLRKLLDAGLVRVRKDGRHRYYRARRGDMGALAVLLEAMWSERLDVLERLAREAESGVERGETLPDETLPPGTRPHEDAADRDEPKGSEPR